MEEEEEENSHSGMRGDAAVSLCCTKQSQAEHLALHLPIWETTEEWRRKKEGEGGRSAGKERVQLVVVRKKKCSPTQVRAQ